MSILLFLSTIISGFISWCIFIANEEFLDFSITCSKVNIKKYDLKSSFTYILFFWYVSQMIFKPYKIDIVHLMTGHRFEFRI